MAIPRNWDQLSLLEHKYNIPSIKIDQERWEKRWEKTLRKLSASEDVFPMLSAVWRGPRFRTHGHRTSPRGMVVGMSERMCEMQKLLPQLEEDLKESSACVAAWLLLDEEERKHHLFKGMKEACWQTSTHFDGRALCPEITTTRMLKQNGKAFMAFARAYMNGVKDAGAGNVYLLPSEWWSSAVTMPKPWPEDVKFAFAHLSLQRNEFISHFVAQTMLSILGDLESGNHGMEKIKNILEADSRIALDLATMRSGKLDKPLIRCQNCTKAPEEIGGNPKFMVCGTCKSELHFVVHYCSRTCQKEDWSKHKLHCGKNKIAKTLPGTIHDPDWEYPLTTSDNLRSYIETTKDGNVVITRYGSGTPDPAKPLSPAIQRQVDLLDNERGTDYFLFDDADRPVACVVGDPYLQICWRVLRSESLFAPEPAGAGIMAQYLIKMAGDRPGLSRAGILAQLESEYGGGVATKVAELEARGVKNGYAPGMTFFEVRSVSMRMLNPSRDFSGL